MNAQFVVIGGLILIVDVVIYFYLQISSSELISILAFELGLGTFWWIYLRKGRLLVPPPRSFSIGGGGDTGKMVLRVPLVFFNNGAIPIIVRNMQIRILEDNEEPLSFSATVFSIEKAGKPEDRRLATQFSIEGRSTHSKVCQFTRRPGIELMPGNYNFVLEAQIAYKKKWLELCRFSFIVREKHLQNINSKLLAYDLCDDQN